MNFPVIVLGGGGHAKVLIDTLLMQSVKILGITDSNADKWSCTLLGIPVLGTDEVVFQYSFDKVLLVNGLGSIKTNNRRKELFERFKKHGYSFASVIHPSAIISRNTTFGEGVQILAGAIVQTGSVIKENTIVNTKVSIDHDCSIGAHVHLAPGVTLSGGVKVKESVHMGTGSLAIQGITIGENSIIGAGAVVVKDIPEGVVAMGVPARILGVSSNY